MPCSPHSWIVVSGKTRQGEALGRNGLLWQCPCAGAACQAFLDIPLFLLLPVTQTSDKYMFNVPFWHEASHDACRINTDGLRVRLRQSAWVCGNICFTKLPSALWQAAVGTAGEHQALLSTLEHCCLVVCLVPCNPLGLALKTCKLLAFFLHSLYFMGTHKHDEQPSSPILHSLCYQGVDGATLWVLIQV